ncbi:hypothetical protein D5S17_35410 [Pseudonocardiaceae bacterium YIM PH 21723]|nr:hypothetical protein D5S17_35410 [Pseudonocardiaceae bacterium YIM PH 21723]
MQPPTTSTEAAGMFLTLLRHQQNVLLQLDASLPATFPGVDGMELPFDEEERKQLKVIGKEWLDVLRMIYGAYSAQAVGEHAQNQGAQQGHRPMPEQPGPAGYGQHSVPRQPAPSPGATW